MNSKIVEITDAGLFVGRVSASINEGTIKLDDHIWFDITHNIYDTISNCLPGMYIQGEINGAI